MLDHAADIDILLLAATHAKAARPELLRAVEYSDLDGAHTFAAVNVEWVFGAAHVDEACVKVAAQ